MTDECDVYDHDWQIISSYMASLYSVITNLKCNICNARTFVEGELEE